MASPPLDATFGTISHGAAVTGTTYNQAYTNKTAAANEVIVAVVSYEQNAGTPNTISSITVAGLTFTKAAIVSNPTAGAHNATIEVWTAPAVAQFNSAGASLTWTFNWAGGTATVDDVGYAIFAISGVYSVTTPLDPNASLPASAFNVSSTGAPVVTFSTTNADDLLIGVSFNVSGYATVPSTPTGWTSLTSPNTGSGNNSVNSEINYMSVSTKQVNATYQDATSGNQVSWTELVLAFTADNPAPAPTTLTDLSRKICRIVAYAAAQVGILKSVNIVTTAPALSLEIKEYVQMTATEFAAMPAGEVPTYMDNSANPAGLPTIFISGYSAPS